VLGVRFDAALDAGEPAKPQDHDVHCGYPG
jgi:hypothetical protein